ncbi:hypothetical protein GDO81_029597 [Engystomops pustulosus]|uniref:MAC-inhibitory protein n=1 Tax=Engystomops pustulosus TaxID=76066 RepID=A0AAV6YM01_ENGPU|nr:hypothetical protein GDO81_029597 [Engystomops pustulosus]
MRGAGTCCVVLAVGLVILSLCSSALALNCYKCGFTASKCESQTSCAAGEDACILVKATDGSVAYGCRAYSRCTIDSVGNDYKLDNLKYQCCQKNLCNGGMAAHPSTYLLLSLAGALILILMS